MSRKLSVEELLARLEAIHLEESQVIRQLRRARSKEAEQQRSNEDSARLVVTHHHEEFYVGCRIEIRNAEQGLTVGNKRGTVYKITDTRVCFTTDNGDNKWRAKRNLRLLPNS